MTTSNIYLIPSRRRKDNSCLRDGGAEMWNKNSKKHRHFWAVYLNYYSLTVRVIALTITLQFQSTPPIQDRSSISPKFSEAPPSARRACITSPVFMSFRYVWSHWRVPFDSNRLRRFKIDPAYPPNYQRPRPQLDVPALHHLSLCLSGGCSILPNNIAINESTTSPTMNKLHHRQ